MKTNTQLPITKEALFYSSSDGALDVRFDPNAWGIPEAAITDWDADFEQLWN